MYVYSVYKYKINLPVCITMILEYIWCIMELMIKQQLKLKYDVHSNLQKTVQVLGCIQ